MNSQILLGLLLTVLPIFELRGGLPIIVEYCVREGVSVWPYFLAVLILNVLLIFLIFVFFDFFHEIFMRSKLYRTAVNRPLNRIHRKVDKLERRMDRWGYFGLMLFVAVPLPVTGAWTGTILAWILGLDRIRSFAAIAAGVVIAGLAVLLFSLGFFVGIY